MTLGRLDGILNINKPAGISSRKVVDHVLRLVKPTKVGHSGTLDPMATGVLVVCVGAATRLTKFVQQQPKEYRAEFLLGKQSNTDDVTGKVIDVPHAEPVSRTQIDN
ncbi:MAG: tRNA pseudouridine(55) synthase TruB, partial [Planctomycetes bacterium]|nr:tRNA pseudouridine(55) synthase TruB [Planctomycetota bacterium]